MTYSQNYRRGVCLYIDIEQPNVIVFDPPMSRYPCAESERHGAAIQSPCILSMPFHGLQLTALTGDETNDK